MNYLEMLKTSYSVAQSLQGCSTPESRLEFLADDIFDFTTYDPEFAKKLARHAVDVCDAINTTTTFTFIENPENYSWFLIMCNMPFFARRIEWGTSIRGAWWNCFPESHFTLPTCALFDGDVHIEHPKFTAEEWPLFIAAVVEFGRSEPPTKDYDKMPVTALIDELLTLIYDAPIHIDIRGELKRIRDGIFLELPETRCELLCRVGSLINRHVPDSSKPNVYVAPFWDEIRDIMNKAFGRFR
jgi:hypothetical protein